MFKRLRQRHQERLENTADTDNGQNGQKSRFKLLKNLKIAYIPYNELLKEGFFAGLGWAFGVTVGFVVVSTLIVVFLQALGGLPIVGSVIADIVHETQSQLLRRTPLFTQ